MKQAFFLLIIWLSAAAFTNTEIISPLESIFNESIPWEAEVIKADLSIQGRWLKNEKNERTRQLRCITNSELNIDIFKHALKNPEFSKHWLTRVEHCEIIEGNNKNEWHTYLIFDFPWPMAKRDIIIKNKMIETDGELIVQMNGVTDFLAKKDDITRMKGYFGYWKLSSSNKTLEYSIYSNVKSAVPSWISDPFIEKSIALSITKFKTGLKNKTSE